MARPSSIGSLTIAQLENVLNTRRSRLTQLTRERKKVQQKLDAVDRQIASLSGRAGATAGAGGRTRNAKSLVATMEGLLHKSGGAMSVGDLVCGVLKSGYKTVSSNFRGIVNQTLIKEKQFTSAGRGMYTLKK